MITYKQGNLFDFKMQTLVITVNTVGVMGKGIALECKTRFPEIFNEYKELCERKEIVVGQAWSLWNVDDSGYGFLLFPTKKHWRNPSKLIWIEEGLNDFVYKYSSWAIESIAFPALGCGNGGLDFKTQVQPLMEKYLGNLPIEIEVYLP